MADTEQVLTPTGRFRGKVTDHDMGKASTGNPQVAVVFQFSDEEGKTHYINWYGVFTEATIQAEHGICQSLRALQWDPEEQGWQVEQLGKKTAANKIGGVLIGREADLTIEIEEYKGKKRAKVAWVNAPGGGMMKDRCDTPESLSEVSNVIRSLAGAGAGPEPKTGQRPPSKAATAPKTTSVPGRAAAASPKTATDDSALPF